MRTETHYPSLPAGWAFVADAAEHITIRLGYHVSKFEIVRAAGLLSLPVRRVFELCKNPSGRKFKRLSRAYSPEDMDAIVEFMSAQCSGETIDEPGSYMPTPEEIRAMCLEIQANRERKRREMGWEEPEPVAEIPVIPIAKVHVYSRRAEY
jgi:hypothetical protein